MHPTKIKKDESLCEECSTFTTQMNLFAIDTFLQDSLLLPFRLTHPSHSVRTTVRVILTEIMSSSLTGGETNPITAAAATGRLSADIYTGRQSLTP